MLLPCRLMAALSLAEATPPAVCKRSAGQRKPGWSVWAKYPAVVAPRVSQRVYLLTASLWLVKAPQASARERHFAGQRRQGWSAWVSCLAAPLKASREA